MKKAVSIPVALALTLCLASPVLAAPREKEPRERSPIVKIIKKVIGALADFPIPPKP